MARKTPTSEREVVLVEDLVPVLKKALAPLFVEYQQGLSLAGMGGVKVAAPLQTLSDLSGVPERRIYGILHGENTYVDLDVADRLLLNLGLYVELEVPDGIVTEAEAQEAARVQQTMIPGWMRARGRVYPTCRKERRTVAPSVRKEAFAEAQRTLVA